MTSELRHFGAWANVPVDGDVRPFSVINPVRDGGRRSNRKHHFVSVTYMNGFTDARGRVQVYRPEDPRHPHATLPISTGYENNHYSQPLPEGGLESHRFEDLWNSIETVWPETVCALEARRLSPAISLNVQGMMSIMRVRVPAARDRTAIMLEAKLRSECKVLEEMGRLPPEYERYAGRFDKVPIGINPHHTLLAMNRQFLDMGDLGFRLGFEILHNRTGTPFITSDNPVSFYDRRRSLPGRIPYETAGQIELTFPLTASMLLRGTTRLRPANMISRHKDVRDAALVRRLNRTTAQFAYRMSIARDRSSDDLIASHADLVPTITTETRRDGGEVRILVRDVFGQRPLLDRYIDTPEKAARLEERMRQEGWT